MKNPGIKHEGRAAYTAQVAAVEVFRATGDKEVIDTEPWLPDRNPPPPLDKVASNTGADEVILSPELY